MILNVSGRTDIVEFYSDWFFYRLKVGFVDVRNPFNQKMVVELNSKMLMQYFFVQKILYQSFQELVK